MQTISNTALDSVTGGGTPLPGGSSSASATPTPTGTSSSSGSGCHDPLLGELSTLNQTLQQLSHKNNGFDSTDMLMFGMAMAFSRPAAPGVVYVGGGGGWGCHCRRW